MMQTIDQLATIAEIEALLRKIEDNANEIWYVDGREVITVRRGKQAIQIMVWRDDGRSPASGQGPVQALAARW